MRHTLFTLVIAGAAISVAASGLAQTTPAPQTAPAQQTAPAPAPKKDEGGMGKGAKIASIAGIAAGAITASVVIAKSGPDKKSSTVSFASLDVNNDGALSSAEFKTGMANMFKAVDANGDGSLSREEATAAFPNKGGSYFDLLDPQKTGAVSAAAFTDAATKVFAAADTNADGSISAAERDAAKVKATGTN